MQELQNGDSASPHATATRRWPRAGTWIGAVAGILATLFLFAAVMFGSPVEPWFLAPITCLWIRSGADPGRLFVVCPFFEWLTWGILVDLVRLWRWRRRLAG